MNHLSTKSRLAAAAALFACASAANAAEFTFNVPVSLKSISPESARGWIGCSVYDVAPPAAMGAIPPFANQMTGGTGVFTLSRGAYEGTITITANVGASRNPAEARGYICRLHLSEYVCISQPDAEPCRRSREPGNSVEVKGEIKR